ncbi:hypothetical protein DY052_05915 [Apilactobacillus timberlakei]|uniref:hypothetical protein n=1 Tax=Apilactobacillus timberlakei TaxID=2008380 RepID=UPI001128406F|nr:hypothetical protein [Apilactobacillus timberlakei]TPR14959.1 hypothetical protein DY052_05915 [Apilactobacillus timberlakei]
MAFLRREYKTTDLQAMSQAYRGNAELSSSGKYYTPLVCIVSSIAFGYYLYTSIIWGIIWGLVGLWYSYLVLYPQEVSSFYYRKGNSQRWNAVNNMYTSLSNVNNDAEDVIQVGIDSSEGEFQQDLQRLLAALSLRKPDKVNNAFKQIEDKYDEDIQFKQFMEQINIYFDMGVPDMKSFKRLNKNYNIVYEIQKKGRSSKNLQKVQFGFALIVVFVAVIGISKAMGGSNWVDTYSHVTSGIVTNSIAMTIAFLAAHHIFFKRYYKDSANVTNSRSFKK